MAIMAIVMTTRIADCVECQLCWTLALRVAVKLIDQLAIQDSS